MAPFLQALNFVRRKPSPSALFAFGAALAALCDTHMARLYVARRVRCFNGQSWNQNESQRFQHELKRLIGSALQRLDPGYSFCRHCNMPWWVGPGHTVWFSGTSSGAFVVCENCFHQQGNGLDEDALVQLYKELFADGRPEIKPWAELESEIRKDYQRRWY